MSCECLEFHEHVVFFACIGQVSLEYILGSVFHQVMTVHGSLHYRIPDSPHEHNISSRIKRTFLSYPILYPLVSQSNSMLAKVLLDHACILVLFLEEINCFSVLDEFLVDSLHDKISEIIFDPRRSAEALPLFLKSSQFHVFFDMFEDVPLMKHEVFVLVIFSINSFFLIICRL